MAYSQEQRGKQKQDASQSPRLIAAIGLLEKSHLEVQQAIQEELQANPMLEDHLDDEAGVDTTHEQSEDVLRSSDDGRVEISDDWDENDPNHEEGWPSNPYDEERLSPTERARDQSSETLRSYLYWQLMLSDLNVVQKEIGLNIIGNLNEYGFLEMTAQELCQDMGRYLPETVEQTIRLIQQFDPIGIATKDLQECLLVQARASIRTKRTICEVIIRDHWVSLVNRKTEEIARALSVPLSEVKSAVSLISSALIPRPGGGHRFRSRSLLESTSLSQVQPDLYVYEDGHDFRIVPRMDNPRVRLSPKYDAMLRSNGLQESAREFLQEKKKRAEFFLSSLNRRQQTICHLAKSIIKHQREFFETGSELSLRPLISRQIAEDIRIDESTVRRARKNKYLDTPYGLYSMDFFFDKVGHEGENGARIASRGIRETIKRLIRTENKSCPYSDRELGEILETYKVRVGRRVIEKYRDSAGFPESRMRKRLNMGGR
ncbi:MAG: RNA polymerase sigma-54 factor [Desulfobacteraceae bacterium]|nr:MAG: RNA polymerase sigma-54 factor [Desulfobacteraceae bacterium]